MFELFSILIPFLIVHIMFDFYLQPSSWVKDKKSRTYKSPKLYIHSLLHGVALLIPAIFLDINIPSIICLVIVVSASHFVIDLWKIKAKRGEEISHFLIDQALHVIVLTVISFHIMKDVSLRDFISHDSFSLFLTVTFGYLIILKPTSIVISGILRKYPITSPNSPNTATNGLISGGELIGYLERILILTFTLIGAYSAIGFVMAAKSIFRFGELSKSQDRSMTEYVLIGSLLSVAITTVIGVLIIQAFDIIKS